MPHKSKEARQAYERKRAQDPQRILAMRKYRRAWAEANPEVTPAAIKRWKQNNPEKSFEYTVLYRARHPEKSKAHNAVTNAIRNGHLIPQPCAVCGVKKVDAHHEDYSKPLEVIWLCRKHHNIADRARLAQEAAELELQSSNPETPNQQGEKYHAVNG